MKAEGEGWDPLKLAKAYCLFQGGTFIVVIFVHCYVMFHFRTFFFY